MAEENRLAQETDCMETIKERCFILLIILFSVQAAIIIEMILALIGYMNPVSISILAWAWLHIPKFVWYEIISKQ